MRTGWAIISALVMGIGCGGATATGDAEPGGPTGGRNQGGASAQSQGPQKGGTQAGSDHVQGDPRPTAVGGTSGASGVLPSGGSGITTALRATATGGSMATTGGTRANGGSTVTTGGIRANGGSSWTSVVIRADGGAPKTTGGASTGGFASGGSLFGGSPNGGTGNRNFAGDSSLAGAIDPCSLPGAHCTPGRDDWPECTQRGGACVGMSSSSGECPDGSYNPFSKDTYCPASFIGHCCVPNGDVGSPCGDSSWCRDGGACWSEAAHYPSGGVCGHACNAESCPSYGTCITVPWSAAPSVCMVACTESRFCRAGQSCQAFSKKYGGGEIAYACWFTGSPTGKGLGDECARDSGCLSYYCRPDAAGTRRCSAPCDASNPCLSGYTCVTDPTCSGTQCDFCFPK